MMLAFLVMVVGLIVARFMKKKTWWLKVHRFLGISAVILVFLGLFAEALQLSLAGRPHFRSPHSWIGVMAVGFAVLTPIFGLLQIKVRKAAARIRGTHRWFGRITLLLMFFNIILGLSMIGII